MRYKKTGYKKINGMDRMTYREFIKNGDDKFFYYIKDKRINAEITDKGINYGV